MPGGCAGVHAGRCAGGSEGGLGVPCCCSGVCRVSVCVGVWVGCFTNRCGDVLLIDVGCFTDRSGDVFQETSGRGMPGTLRWWVREKGEVERRAGDAASVSKPSR